MKPFILLLSLCFTTTVLSSQSPSDCEQLVIKFHGIIESEEVDQLFFEVSNVLYTGNLYYYPGFILLNEQGDTIAKEDVKYYGISTNFQTHLLNIETDISFPFTGKLELFGSYYQNQFCSFPFEIEKADYVSLVDIEREEIKVATNFANDLIVLDLNANDVHGEQLDYNFNVTNERSEVVYSSRLTTNTASIPIDSIGGTGNYFISVWDGINEKLLPTKQVKID